MDFGNTLAPKSDQLDAVDLLTGPRTFTVERVTQGNAEQPVQIHLAEFDRPWRPGKSMRRVLAACWGSDTTKWGAGRRVRLWCDPEVRFGGQAVGGVRILAMTHLENDEQKRIPLIVTRGKSATYTVDPLTTEVIVDDLRAEWTAADPDRRKAIEAEVQQLTGGAA